MISVRIRLGKIHFARGILGLETLGDDLRTFVLNNGPLRALLRRMSKLGNRSLRRTLRRQARQRLCGVSCDCGLAATAKPKAKTSISPSTLLMSAVMLESFGLGNTFSVDDMANADVDFNFGGFGEWPIG